MYNKLYPLSLGHILTNGDMNSGQILTNTIPLPVDCSQSLDADAFILYLSIGNNHVGPKDFLTNWEQDDMQPMAWNCTQGRETSFR